jgi:thiol-disulfide isomerase/thioredoxin
VVAVRSPYRVPAFLTEPDSAPLIKVLDTLGRPLEGLATIRAVPLITEIANAGAVATDGDAVYFAPMTTDEIRKYDRGGKLVWTATRGLATPPRLVNIAIALAGAPNGRLYVLGANDSTRLRVDVLDTADGTILATRELGARETAIALDHRDSLIGFDADSLTARLGAAGREAFAPPVTLPTVNGDSVRVPTDHDGYVRLVNFWASWCDPCREEFPYMGDLARAFSDRRFVILAISDDVDRSAMLDFLRRYDPGNLVVLAGGGRMKARYHYRGLPYSVLIDRQGRVVERIFGFGGEREFARLRQTIAKEVAEP